MTGRSRMGHCCFAGCDLVTCNRCGEQRCVRDFHVCPPPPEGRGQTAYRHPKRGKAHRIDIPLDPQPDPWDQAYSGLTGCGFRLRWAFPVSTNVAAPEDLCRVCWPKEAT